MSGKLLRPQGEAYRVGKNGRNQKEEEKEHWVTGPVN